MKDTVQHDSAILRMGWSDGSLKKYDKKTKPKDTFAFLFLIFMLVFFVSFFCFKSKVLSLIFFSIF